MLRASTIEDTDAELSQLIYRSEIIIMDIVKMCLNTTLIANTQNYKILPCIDKL